MALEKISVIIPTVQKSLPVLKKLLEILAEDKTVAEILIINNAIKDLTGINNTKKIKIITPLSNLYVNASWNLGIESIENEIFLIINDDILPVKNFCTKVIKSGIFDKKTTGFVGINNQFINQFDRMTTSNIEIPDAGEAELGFTALNKYRDTGDWGSAFFGKKRNWHKIPSDLKIIYGDNYLLYQNIQDAKVNYQMTGLPFNHIHSLSSAAPEFNNIVCDDIRNSGKYIP